MEHGIKCWMEFFEETWQGRKTFELRLNDRDYNVGDVVLLREFDHIKRIYTGRIITGTITYLIEGPRFGLAEGWCCFQLRIDDKGGLDGAKEGP